MTKKIMGDQYRAYEAITKDKVKYGVYHKTCFHVHTPASYDYRLLKDWTDSRYKKATDEELYNLCVNNHVFPKDLIKLEDIAIDKECFSSIKEFLSYLLLANTIKNHGIEIVLVSDHNNINGFNKLQIAIKQLFDSKPSEIYPVVSLGIEISCADRIHIVGIFDEKQQNITSKINKWLDENLISEKDGTYKTSLEVLNSIESLGGIGYIAHIDTADIFKDDHFSNGYKKRLFADDSLKIIGTKRYDQKDKIQNIIRKYRSQDVKIVLDNDAHEIDTISNNIFWIKGSRRNFSMIKEAINDYDISISFHEEHINHQYIKGIYIENASKGFLTGKKSQAFCLTFSNALNCIIGGRGTGKSSILEMIEYVLSQRCKDEEMLEFICAHGNTWILYHFCDEDFLIEMRMPKASGSRSVLQYFSRDDNYFGYNYRHLNYNKDTVSELSLRKYLKLYKVVASNGKTALEQVKNKSEMLSKFFDTKYSVNELVNTTNNDKINNFIFKTMFENRVLSEPQKIIKCRKKSGLQKALNDAQQILNKRMQEVQSIIDPFNKNQRNKLRIVYSQNGHYKDPALENWLFEGDFSKNRWYKKYNIKNQNVIEYLLSLYHKQGFFDFLITVINADTQRARKAVDLLSFCDPLSQNMIDDGVREITSKNLDVFLKNLFNELISNNTINWVINYLKEYVSGIERFDLEFNINNKEGSQGKAIFRNVKKLSLGQKVVAMFSFVLGYSEYSNDYRPLIIDQPEDNLDNQYIYKNLVSQLRAIKEKRQIIIATHNATIVTNAKADQVCVMNSNNVHGWIEKVGYPGERSIKKHIINYLEGGKESFKHKYELYKDVLS